MIVFRNPGLIDLRAIKAFGVSVKPGTDTPIGQFGSGLKMALALLLRTDHRITLFRGLDRYVFGTKLVNIRGKDFDFVTMTGPAGEEELPFNTHTAFQWKVWQGFRELHSNVLDEKGGTFAFSGAYEPRADETAILVEGDEMERAYAERDLIFLSSRPFIEAERCTVHDGVSTWGFYRGIRVIELRQPSLFTYNLRNATLTEDRTLTSASDLEWAAIDAIARSTDEDFTRRAITAPSDVFEHHLPIFYASLVTPGDTFLRVFNEVTFAGRRSEIAPFANKLFLSVKGNLPLPAEAQLNKIQSIQLKRAKAFCKRAGWDVESFPIVVVDRATGGLYAYVQDGKIVLTTQLFDMGIKSIVHGLYEEWMHLKTGMKDETRELQTHLFQTIICLQEQLLEEPL